MIIIFVMSGRTAISPAIASPHIILYILYTILYTILYIPSYDGYHVDGIQDADEEWARRRKGVVKR